MVGTVRRKRLYTSTYMGCDIIDGRGFRRRYVVQRLFGYPWDGGKEYTQRAECVRAGPTGGRFRTLEQVWGDC